MYSQQPDRKPRFYSVFFRSQGTCRESEAPSHGPRTLPGPRLRRGGWGGVCAGTPAPILPWGGIRPCWVIKAFTSLKCLVPILILLIWDYLSVISRDGKWLLGKRENPLTNINTQVCSDKRPSAVCLLSNPNICDRINVSFTHGKINKKWRMEGSHILQSCVYYTFFVPFAYFWRIVCWVSMFYCALTWLQTAAGTC